MFYNSGGSGFPFTRNSGAIIEHGCLNIQTVAKSDNALFWVGEDRVIYRSNGVTPQVLSVRSIEDDIEDRDIGGGFVVSDRGPQFYVLRITGRPSYAYNLTTGLWGEFSTGVNHAPWIATNALWASGVQYIATTTGKICTQSGYNDDGEIIRAELVSTPIVQGGEYFTINKVHLNLVTGKSSPATTPQVVMQLSHDGKTWGGEQWRDLGLVGQYMRRATWHAQGAFRWAQGRVWITDEVDRDIIGGSYG